MESSSSSSPTVKFTMGFTSPPADKSLMSKTATPLNLTSNTTIDLKDRSTAFTPILTPNRGGSMVLLSPARTITGTLTALAASTGQQLEEVWDEVGYSPEDRASQLSDLLVRIRDLCEEKIAEEKGVAETFRNTIQECREEMTTIAGALKTSVDPQLLTDNSGQTLTDELAVLEAALEGLRSASQAAKEDLIECRDYIVEAHEALGLELNAKWRDIQSDLTISRREEFHRKKTEMREELSSRMSAVIQLVRDCQQLLDDLRIEPEKEGTEIDRRIGGSLVRSKDGSFILASKFRSETCVGLSSIALEELTKRVAELHTEKRRRKTKLQDMGAAIAMLWEKLHVPEEEQRAFTESVQGLGMDTMMKGEMELARLQRLKSDMLGNLIEEARQQISTLWEEIDATEESRLAFEPFNVADESFFTEELLDKHEEYIGELRSRLEQMKPILRLIERREVVVRERFEYDELQKDSDRLKQRGAAMTRQLMEEEKMAKRIKKDLPRLTELLEEKLGEWKATNDEDFLYRGEFYLERMNRQEDEWNRYKAEEVNRKLKKKQEEKTFVETLHGPVPAARHPGRRKAASRPLGDAGGQLNSRQPLRNRKLETKGAPAKHRVESSSNVQDE